MPERLRLRLVRLAGSDRFGRPTYVAGLVVGVAGLILGTAYAGPLSAVSLLVAGLLGGVLALETDSVRGKAVYGNVLAAAVGGVVLGSATVSAVVSLSLGLPPLNVVVSTAPRIVTSAAGVATLAMLGYVAGIAVSLLDLRAREPVAATLLVVGSLGFALVQARLAGVGQDLLALPERSVGVAAWLAGAGVFVGVVSLLRARDRRRRRLALAAVVLVAVVAGGLGVGSVGAQISTARTGSAVADQLVVEVAAVDASDDVADVTLRIENPSDHGVELAGVTLRAANASETRLGYGPGRHVDGPTAVAPGETVTTTYRLQLSPDQAWALRTAFESGDVTVSGRATLRLASVDPLLLQDRAGFSVQFNCTVSENGGGC